MVGNVAFLMKDVVLLAASVYLLKQDGLRVWRPSELPAGFELTGRDMQT
jgi:hypothetical protein